MTDAARDHLDIGPETPPLYGDTEYAEHVSDGNGVLHVCRYDNGDLSLMVDDQTLLQFDEADTRWLAGILVAALDNWPRP